MVTLFLFLGDSRAEVVGTSAAIVLHVRATVDKGGKTCLAGEHRSLFVAPSLLPTNALSMRCIHSVTQLIETNIHVGVSLNDIPSLLN